MGVSAIIYSYTGGRNPVCKIEKGKGNAHKKHAALDEISPKHGFEAACIGVNDCNHTHGDNQYIYIDSLSLIHICC